MNRFFFRDLLEGNPQLLERMLAFNRTAKKDAALPAGGTATPPEGPAPSGGGQLRLWISRRVARRLAHE